MLRIIIQIVAIFIFLLVLVLPKAQEQFSLLSHRQLNENRNRTQKPDAGVYSGTMLERLYRQGVTFSGQYEKYFNDHYGLRDFLIMLKNQIDYSVFGRSDSVILGSEGYLFSKDMVEGELLSAERVPDEVIQRVQNNILAADRILKHRGARLIFILCREKESVYPEKVIHTTAVRPEKTRPDVYVEFFKQHPEIPFIDSKEVLLNADAKYPLFYKTDAHWNSYGAAFLGEKLVNLIASLEGSNTRWSHPFVVEAKDGFSGTQNLYVATFQPKTETAYEIKGNWEKYGRFHLPSPYPFEHYYETSAPESVTVLPATTILGNSFSTYLFKTPTPEYFKSLTYAYKGTSSMETLDTLLLPGSKYLILQVNEFDIAGYWLNENNWRFLGRPAA